MNPQDLTKSSASLTISSDGTVEYSVIDYTKETGPFWYVVVNGTPLAPDRPSEDRGRWAEAWRQLALERRRHAS